MSRRPHCNQGPALRRLTAESLYRTWNTEIISKFMNKERIEWGKMHYLKVSSVPRTAFKSLSFSISGSTASVRKRFPL